MKGFQGYHPIILFLYFILILCFSMFSMHPAVILCSLFGGLLLFGALNGLRKLLSELLFVLGMFLVIAVINPLFVHNGETVFFFMNDNPVTLEAMIYGAFASLMIMSVLVWCRCYASLLTTDKFLYLFGRLIPKFALILSMAFRFIPLFRVQMRRINQSQKTMGLYATDSVPDKVRGAMRVFDSLVSWSMENSLDTADSMKSRGYGLPGRTNFSLYRFHGRDGILLAVLAIFCGLIFLSFGRGSFDFYYYPVVMPFGTGAEQIFCYLAMLGFACVPGIIELKEKVEWTCLKSKI